MKLITSGDNQTVKAAARLLQKKHRDESGKFLVEGKRAVEDIRAYDSSLIDAVFVSEPAGGLAGDYLLPEKVFTKLCETKNSQGIIAIVNKPKPRALSNYSLFLDRVRDPGNVGTLIRTALAAGFCDIHLHDCADAYSGKVVRSTMSAIVKANIFESADRSALLSLKSQGFKVICADMDGRSTYDYRPDSEKKCLVVGNEANGVSDEIKELCDITLSLPMSADIESLNAAVSGGLLMYNLKYLK